jgi:hypothetical protein
VFHGGVTLVHLGTQRRVLLHRGDEAQGPLAKKASEAVLTRKGAVIVVAASVLARRCFSGDR